MTSIARIESAAMQQQGLSREQVELIKATIAKDTTDNELALFVQVCNRTQLDPFARQIYAIKRGGVMTVQTSIDGLRLIAQRSGEHAGTDDAEYDSEDGPHPKWARVTVYRMIKGQRVAFTAKARWDEYVQPNSNTWRKMPYLMIGKVAESLALRKGFPAELSGLYTADEMAQADNDAPRVVNTPKARQESPRQIAAKSQAANSNGDADIVALIAAASSQEELLELADKATALPTEQKKLARAAYKARKAQLEEPAHDADTGEVQDWSQVGPPPMDADAPAFSK